MARPPANVTYLPVAVQIPDEDSLRRLDTDYIDLYQMHRPDYRTSLDETLATDDVLDRIDEIVPPSTELNTADNYAANPPAITGTRLRRRPA